MHDLEIIGGTIVDASGADWFTGDVAIRDAKIGEVGEAAFCVRGK